jgi:hypothetical protein
MFVDDEADREQSAFLTSLRMLQDVLMCSRGVEAPVAAAAAGDRGTHAAVRKGQCRPFAPAHQELHIQHQRQQAHNDRPAKLCPTNSLLTCKCRITAAAIAAAEARTA